MEQTTKRGGLRSNAGRKKSNNPKKAVTLYLEQSIIEKYGLKELRNIIYNTLNQNNGTIAHNPVQEQ
jgi:hypothetical protein